MICIFYIHIYYYLYISSCIYKVNYYFIYMPDLHACMCICIHVCNRVGKNSIHSASFQVSSMPCVSHLWAAAPCLWAGSSSSVSLHYHEPPTAQRNSQAAGGAEWVHISAAWTRAISHQVKDCTGSFERHWGKYSKALNSRWNNDLTVFSIGCECYIPWLHSALFIWIPCLHKCMYRHIQIC